MGPGGVGGLDLRDDLTKTCTREQASVASRESRVASRLLNARTKNSKIGCGSGLILTLLATSTFMIS